MKTASVETLRALVGWSGSGGGPVNWTGVEQAIGLSLPTDYRAFVEIFPIGQFQTFLTVLQPNPPDPPERFAQRVTQLTEQVRSQAIYLESFPHDFYPVPGGLLPWGWVGRDWLLCWRTVGEDPDRWPTVIATTHLDIHHVFAGTMTAAVLDIVAGGPDLADLHYISQACSPPCFHQFVRAPE
jgi:hypothetical protein